MLPRRILPVLHLCTRSAALSRPLSTEGSPNTHLSPTLSTAGAQFVDSAGNDLPLTILLKNQISRGHTVPTYDSPQSEYFISRNGDQLPVEELEIQQKVMPFPYRTVLSNVFGDIRLVTEELTDYLIESLGYEPQVRMFPVKCEIRILGQHGALVEQWLTEKGF